MYNDATGSSNPIPDMNSGARYKTDLSVKKYSYPLLCRIFWDCFICTALFSPPQRDVVYLGWPIAPSCRIWAQMGGGVRALCQRVKLCTWNPNKLHIFLCLARNQQQQVWSWKLPPKHRNRLLWTGDEFLETVFMKICATFRTYSSVKSGSRSAMRKLLHGSFPSPGW